MARLGEAAARVAGLARRTVAQWSADGGPSAAAALAYYALLALAPGLYLAVLPASALLGAGAARRALLDAVGVAAGNDAAVTVTRLLDEAARPGAGGAAATAGVIVLAFGAAGGFVQLQSALNRMWGVSRQPFSLRRLVTRWLLSFLLVAATGVLLLASLATGVAVDALRSLVGSVAPAAAGWLAPLDALASLALTWLLFSLVFGVLPECRVSPRDALLGGAVTAMLFAAGREPIAFYLARAGTGRFFGEGRFVVVLLVWVYYSAQILLLGAEFTQVTAAGHGRGADAARKAAGR